MSQIKWMSAVKARDVSTTISSSVQYQWSPFHRDYAQIVHSDFFKRLAGKTQVHSLSANDHLRTRMTHSVEVAQIAKQISRYFSYKMKAQFQIDEPFWFEFANRLEELTGAACLMHDSGHPPFGHTGAKLLDKLARKFSEDFDDNKQVTRLILNPLWNEKFDASAPLAAAVMKKFDYRDSAYKTEAESLEKVLFHLGLVGCRHPSSIFMEAADDLSYIAADLSDFLRYFIDYSQFQDFCGSAAIQKLQSISTVDSKFDPQTNSNLYGLLLNVFDNKGKRSDEAVFVFSSNVIKSGLRSIFDNLDQFFSGLKSSNPDEVPKNLKQFLTDNSQKPDDFNFLYLKTSRYGEIFYNLKKCSYKDHILEIPNVGSQNLLANRILSDLFDHFETLIHTDFSKSDVFKMLPMDCKGYIRSAHDTKSVNTPARVVVDFISGMTDDYALRLWETIASPQKSRKSA